MLTRVHVHRHMHTHAYNMPKGSYEEGIAGSKEQESKEQEQPAEFEAGFGHDGREGAVEHC